MLISQGHTMSELLSHVRGPSYCIRSENVKCMADCSSFVSNIGNSTDASKTDTRVISFPSLPLKTTTRMIMQRLHLESSGSGVQCYKRGHRVIVGASPSTEDATIATAPLTKEDLVAYLASGCKTKEKWRIGTENEKFGFEIKTLRPMKYEQIADLLNGIAERFDWEKIMEGDNVIGLKQGKQSISLEPGGQFELSGAPLETLHQTCAEVNSHLYEVKAVAEEMGIGFLGIGFHPKWGVKDIPVMPKVNLDFSSEVDMIRKFRAGLALQPDFMSGKLSPIPGELPTLNDWENHLATIYPEVRLKRYLEMRGADGGPWSSLCALPAFWVGILYDEVSLQSVLDITSDWTPEERQMLRNKVPKSGLKTPFRDGLLRHVAEEVVKLAKGGLERRGFKESGFLNEVAEVVRTGVTPAEKLLEMYHGKWGGQSVDPVFVELLY
ncbi:hypothetical protein RHMOL_Rhmol02G0287000 [Rhododendron molle]|uniref:Uncharacterized protein n=1 Tax=Rhododendron molle TaxID=49168 RepID=A0ACC0PXQ0_RHOML|nr:hypothetical protein RHMOL_Rhmol02G0287000 [Rhododendron molle]